jgi:hypothetical protein
MGMKVVWYTVCDCCGEKMQSSIPLTNKTRYGITDEDGLVHPYMEIWSPGIPAGWIVMPLELEGLKFFCCVKCGKKWLRENGYGELAKDLVL